MSVGSLTRRLPREKTDSAVDAPAGKVSWDRADIETAKYRMLREDFMVQHEANTGPGRMGQPDLTVTSPWKQQPYDLMYAGPLCQLVYGGILEKSCPSMVLCLGATLGVHTQPASEHSGRRFGSSTRSRTTSTTCAATKSHPLWSDHARPGRRGTEQGSRQRQEVFKAHEPV
ncbi:hypothetical protein NHX12_018200 [Muraenolepis orangiensis]|uniref:Uncharacterized protein n=1 Tax=Muraenolepis orangiensis TaxID=630683 RepID=A0A9Q0EWT2_9TELE|nr:hypothetical protein NHX12_018200 [Muraenolepis orangiensis]